MIYGVALLAACMFFGSLIGNLLGLITGLGSDIGGVGFAMLLLLVVTNSKKSLPNCLRAMRRDWISGKPCTFLW